MLGIIGDIHGCLNTLDTLVKKVKQKYSTINLYSVGDLVDRGNFSCETIDYIISEGINFTPGNHDYMFLSYVENPASNMGRAWVYNDYETTMDSYEGRIEKMSEHLSAIKKAPLCYNLDDCFISHAGISALYKFSLPWDFKNDLTLLYEYINRDVEDQKGILWTRGRLLDIGKLQVVGHTQRPEFKYSRDNNVLYIDTSVYTGNKLSAAIVENNAVIEVISVGTCSEDIY